MSGNLRALLDEARNAKDEPQQTDIEDTMPLQKPLARPKSNSPAKRERVIGKSSNPAYEPVKVYVRSDLRRKAERKFEDTGGRDLSDLVETLLAKYLGA